VSRLLRTLPTIPSEFEPPTLVAADVLEETGDPNCLRWAEALRKANTTTFHLERIKYIPFFRRMTQRMAFVLAKYPAYFVFQCLRTPRYVGTMARPPHRRKGWTVISPYFADAPPASQFCRLAPHHVRQVVQSKVYKSQKQAIDALFAQADGNDEIYEPCYYPPVDPEGGLHG